MSEAYAEGARARSGPEHVAAARDLLGHAARELHYATLDPEGAAVSAALAGALAAAAQTHATLALTAAVLSAGPDGPLDPDMPWWSETWPAAFPVPEEPENV